MAGSIQLAFRIDVPINDLLAAFLRLATGNARGGVRSFED